MSDKVSLIISFYNKIDLLRLIFAALERQTYKEFEVIIADDGSKLDVVIEIKQMQTEYSFPIKHVWHEDNGWQKNKILNKAIVATESEYLIFIDGDCIPHPLFIQEHVENRKQNQIVSGRRVMLPKKVSEKLTIAKIKKGYLEHWVFFPLAINSVFGKNKIHFENFFRIRNKYIRRFFIIDKIKGFWGCNFSLFKIDVLKVNGFDERFVYPGTGEDADLEDRLKRIGVIPISKKHMVTQYHYFHTSFNTWYEPNFMLREENNRNKVTYTPFGINKI
jgi:glycosyltransferase involved in cell wall biosynthesis